MTYLRLMTILALAVVFGLFPHAQVQAQSWVGWEIETGGQDGPLREYLLPSIIMPTSPIYGLVTAAPGTVDAAYYNSGEAMTTLYYESTTAPPQSLTVRELTEAGTAVNWTGDEPAITTLIDDGFSDPIITSSPLFGSYVDENEMGVHLKTYSVTVVSPPAVCPYDLQYYTGIVSIPTRVFKDSVTAGGDRSDSSLTVGAGWYDAIHSDSRGLAFTGPQTYYKWPDNGQNKQWNRKHGISARVFDYGQVGGADQRFFKEPYLPAPDGTMMGQVGLTAAPFTLGSEYPTLGGDLNCVTYTAGLIGNWAGMNLSYAERTSLQGCGRDVQLVSASSDEWNCYSVPPLNVLYPGPVYIGKVEYNGQNPILFTGDCGKTDHITLTVTNGSNAGSPYDTGNDGDGAVAQAKYNMTLRYPIDNWQLSGDEFRLPPEKFGDSNTAIWNAPATLSFSKQVDFSVEDQTLGCLIGTGTGTTALAIPEVFSGPEGWALFSLLTAASYELSLASSPDKITITLPVVGTSASMLERDISLMNNAPDQNGVSAPVVDIRIADMLKGKNEDAWLGDSRNTRHISYYFTVYYTPDQQNYVADAYGLDGYDGPVLGKVVYKDGLEIVDHWVWSGSTGTIQMNP